MALQGVVALVRGGNGGHGRLICREPAREGAEVAGERVPADSPQKKTLDGDDCEGTAVAVCRGDELPPVFLDSDLSDRRQAW